MEGPTRADTVSRRKIYASTGWPSQDIRSLHSFLALANPHLIAPSTCIAHTIEY